MESLSDRHISVDAGLPEACWQHASAFGMARELTCCQIVSSTSRLVVVAPHPDDELLCCGGLMQTHSAAGGEIVVVSVTRGERSHGDRDRCFRDGLALRRTAERTEGFALAGLPQITTIELCIPDGSVSDHETTLVTRLLFLLRPTDSVVTTWRWDGHPDHESVGAACAMACSIVSARLLEAPVWMWHWAELDDTRVPWHQLRRVRLSSERVERKVKALQAHSSQHECRSADDGAVLDTKIMARQRRKFECFFVNDSHLP